MPTGNTTLLGLALPVQGELDGTWGNVVNQQLTELLDTAIAGTTTLSTDADVTLTTTVLAANQARQAILLWTANGTTTRNITAPAQSKPYIVINASAGTQSIVIRGAGPTTGVTLIKGEKALVAWNGTDFVKVASSDGDGTFTTVDTTNLEVTNIKAKDGTAAATIADTTGIITVSSQLNVDNLNLSTNTISSTNANGNIVLAPNGTGDVQVDADTLRVGDAAAAATITTNGAGNLTLSTNSGTNSGTIVINQGVNGNILLAPNGTGLSVAQLTTAATNTVTPVMRLDSQSSGTPAVGIGVGLQFAAETAAGNTEVGATLEAITTDVTAASEDFDLSVKLMIAGAAAAEVARFKSTGLTLATGDTYQINNTDVLSATTLGSGVTASSLTSVGTITSGTWSASTIAVANGGTGLTSGTSGGILYYSAAGTLASSAALAASSLVVGGGAGVAPSTITTGTGVTTALGVNTGTAGAFVVNGGALGTPSSGTVTNLTGTASININGTVGATTPNTGAFTSVTSTSAAGVLTRAAATQDGVELIGRAGGTTSLKVTLTPTTLTASRTLTLPDNSGTVLTSGATVTIAQGGTNGTATPTAGTVAYGTGTAYAFTAAGTSGQVLRSNGASAPSWVNGTISGVSLGSNLNTLTLNTSGTGLSGSTTYNGSGAATFTVTSNATSANTASTIVARDASNGFSAGAISATTSGGTSTITVQDTGVNGANIRLNGNGATTPNKFIRAINGNFEVINSAYSAVCFSVTDGGNLTATGNVTAYSDERLKKDWVPLASGFIDQLAAVKSGTYTRTDSGARQVGVSAQELQNVLTEAVAVDDKGYLAVAYGNAALVACIELAKEVIALRAEIAALR